MSDDLEEIRGKAEVSVGLVRKLVASWLPKESLEDRKQASVATPRAANLYATDPAQAQRNAQLKRRLVGTAPDGTEITPASRKQKKGTVPPCLPNHVAPLTTSTFHPQYPEEAQDDDEERLLHKIASKSIKKPSSALSSYLDRTGSKKKKKKKSKKQPDLSAA
ncbi:hypothetical protein HKX48_000112 [Thoreauomyces humboldtii]|nr:hypothetical protein HKX48_000112 [Thoreauomyces humboldtii]